MRLSGLQKEVLSLYRRCLRESRQKPTVSPHRRIPSRPSLGTRSEGRSETDADVSLGDDQEARPHFEAFARAEFKKHRDVEKRDFAAIEFLLRKGRRQLEVMASPGIKDVR